MMGKLKRQLGLFDLLIIGIGGAVGTGVLFSTAGMAAATGPSVILAWLIGGAMYMFIAFTYVDLSTLYPEAGGPSRYSLYTHGKTTNMINAFADLIWYLFIPPIEALATVEGVNYFWPHLVTSGGNPTTLGAVFGIVLMIAFLPFNYYGIKAFAQSTNLLGVIKLGLYLLMGIGFVAFAHFGNFSRYGFAPFGANGLMAAIPLGMFAFGGIRVVPDYAEEVKDRKVLGPAIVWVVIGQVILYLVLTVGLVASINWGRLHFTPGKWVEVGQIAGNAFLTIAHSSTLAWLIVITAIIAIIGPFVTGYIYQGSGSRVMLAMGRTGIISKRMQEISSQTAIPLWALMAFTVIGAIVAYIAAPLPSIYNLIGDAVVAGYMGFAVNPPALLALRRLGHQGYLKNSAVVNVVAVVAFASASAIIYWSGWPDVPYAMILLVLASLIFGLVYRVKEHFANAVWYMVYLLFLTGMTYLGGPAGVFNIDLGTAIVVVVALVVFLPWGVASRLPTIGRAPIDEDAQTSA